jgi:uridine kinase
VIDGSKVKLIIVEGLFVLYDTNLRSLYDLKIFTLLDPDICLARRLQRDIEERGNTYKQTIEQYQRDVKPSYLTFIEPTKKYADIIISTSEYTDTSISIDVLKAYIVTKL